MKVKLIAAVLGLVALAMALPPLAGADVLKVEEGESIQAAIDEADPGDTVKIKPGTYRENVLVTEDDITIRGSGWDDTELVPPATPAPVCGAEGGSVNGICAADIDSEFNVLSVIENLKVKDVAVRGFSGSGIFLYGNDGATIVGNLTEDNEEYGIAAFSSTHGVYSWNVTPRNGEAGVYVGDSPNADAEVEHNVSYSNRGFGIFVRDASNGEAEHNNVYDNCIGILVLNTGANPHTWEISDNRVVENNRVCEADPEEGGPPVSGAGILIASATDIDIEDNLVLGNRPGAESFVAGGIIVLSLGEGTADSGDVKVARNVAFQNDPFDLLWDGTGEDVRFFGNRCKTSDPDGLCESRRHGHGHKKHHKHHNKKHHKHHGHGHDRD